MNGGLRLLRHRVEVVLQRRAWLGVRVVRRRAATVR